MAHYTETRIRNTTVRIDVLRWARDAKVAGVELECFTVDDLTEAYLEDRHTLPGVTADLLDAATVYHTLDRLRDQGRI